MSRYRLADGIRVQRTYLKGSAGNILQYAQSQLDNPDFDPDATILAVSHDDENSVLSMNMAAGFVFETLTGGLDEEQAMDAMARLFDADRSQIESDFAEARDELLAYGVITRA